jgi:hypothetical protein
MNSGYRPTSRRRPPPTDNGDAKEGDGLEDNPVESGEIQGSCAGRWVLPEGSRDFAGYLFLGAILAATSASVSVRVLKDLGRFAPARRKSSWVLPS